MYAIYVETNELVEVPGADAAYFRSLESEPTGFWGYWADSDQTFFMDRVFQSPKFVFVATDLQLHPTTDVVVALDQAVIHSRKGVFYRGVLQTSVRYLATFRAIHSGWYKDNQTVYGTWNRLNDLNVSPNGFVLTGFSSFYGKKCSQNKVVYHSGEIAGADCATFVADSNWTFAKDITSCYRSGQKIGPASHESCAGF